MHIMMVTNNYSPYAGGVVSSINATVQALQELGHHVTLITFDFLGKAHNDPVWVKRLFCPIKFRYKTNHMAVAWCSRKQLNKLIRSLKPDIVHVHHPFLLGYRAAHIAKAEGIPVVFTYHTLYEAYAHYVCLPRHIATYLIKRRVHSFCQTVNGIIAPGSAIQAMLRAEGVTVPIKTVPSGLQSIFLSEKTGLRSSSVETIRLLTVGRMVKEKNVEALLRVALALQSKEVSFVFTLVGYGAEYNKLKKYAYDELALRPDRVIFIHQPPKEQILECYRTSDVFLFASQTDTQGLVLAEAMAAGVSVVALDGPGQRDIIVNEQNGYIVANEAEMVQRILGLYEQPDRLKELSNQACETAKRYCPKRLAEELVAFYKQIRA
jgi:1,2-diacylglycerol 3-alpha-glucosyltransferase